MSQVGSPPSASHLRRQWKINLLPFVQGLCVIRGRLELSDVLYCIDGGYSERRSRGVGSRPQW